VLGPVLIYRAYKRSHQHEHGFHITTIVALILTIIDVGPYPPIFVVLATPNFPENPLKLLLVSPFNVPKKLVHRS
jgi:hypothetical protein